MTIWYLDPENGNDANTGQSFAQRKRTPNALAVQPGDSVRIIADYGAQSLGSATWADNSATVTLAAAQTLTVDNCETNWTGTTGITTAVSSGYQKQGNTALAVTFGSGFNTGLVCYKALSNLDLSAYACLSLWLNCGNSWGGLTTPLSIALCSDSGGQTPIVMLPFPTWLVNLPKYGQHFAILIENGGNPLPSGINSIALYAPNGRPFTDTLYLDNIIATKPYGAPGHLSHCTLIGKHTAAEPEWYPINSIDGTKVVIGNAADYGGSLVAADTPSTSYRGVSETITTYGLCAVRTRSTYAQTGISTGGTRASPITCTGGWNRTDMSTQTGTSWLTGEFSQGSCLIPPNVTYGTIGWLNFPDKTIGFAGYVGSSGYQGSNSNTTILSGTVGHYLGFVGNWTTLTIIGSTNVAIDLDLGNYVRNVNGFNPAATIAAPFKLRARRITGCTNNYAVTAGLAIGTWYTDTLADLMIDMIDNNYSAVSSLGNTGRGRLRGTVFKNNKQLLYLQSAGEVLLDRPTLLDGPPVIQWSTTGMCEVRCTNVNGNAWDNRVYTQSVTQQMVQSPTHGSTQQSLALMVGANYASLNGLPYLARIARIACFAHSTVTFTAWMQRTSQMISGGLLVQSGQVAGVAAQTVTGSAANNTWEQATVSFTPTENGVVDVFGWVQSQNDPSANGAQVVFGDTSVTST